MKIQRLLVAVTIVNLALLIFLLAQSRLAGAQGVSSVLRGRAFQIVDDHGRIRASITVLPANPTVKMPDGTTGYPETVLFRLINSQGRPNVKIEATEQGAGIGLGGESDPTYALMTARGASTSLKLTDKNGQQQLIKP
jgi:hypothetical protein